MSISEPTIDHGTLRGLLSTGVPVGAEVIASGGRWTVVIQCGRRRQTLTATRGRPKTFRQFETLASYLKNLGIVEYRVNAAGFDPESASDANRDLRSQAASARMKRAHEAAAYDTWFRAQVQASVDDPRPSATDEQARSRMASHRQALLGLPTGTRSGGTTATRPTR